MQIQIYALLHRRLAAMGVPIECGVPAADPLADTAAEGDPFAGVRVGGGREAFRRCNVFIGNLVLPKLYLVGNNASTHRQ